MPDFAGSKDPMSKTLEEALPPEPKGRDPLDIKAEQEFLHGNKDYQRAPIVAPASPQAPVKVPGDVLQIATGEGTPAPAQDDPLTQTITGTIDTYGRESKELQGVLKQYGDEAKPILEKIDAKLKQDRGDPKEYEKSRKFEEYRPDQKTNLIFGAALAGMVLLFGGKAGARGAVAAATGMMNGYHEGNLERAKEARANYNTYMSGVNQRNDAIQREYQEAREKYKDDLAGLQAELTMIGAKWNIPILAKQTEMGDTMAALKFMDAHRLASERLKALQQGVNQRGDYLQFQRSKGKLTQAQQSQSQTITDARDQFLALEPAQKARVLRDGRNKLPSAWGKLYADMTKTLPGGDPWHSEIDRYALEADAKNPPPFPWSARASKEAAPPPLAAHDQPPGAGGAGIVKTFRGPDGQPHTIRWDGQRWLDAKTGQPVQNTTQGAQPSAFNATINAMER